MRFISILVLSITLSILTIAMPSKADATEFCSGFKRGYITGYKKASGSSLRPLTPICPIQPLKGLNDPKGDYEHGYIIGYETGLEKGSE